MPLCGSPDLYSDRNSNLSFSYSKYRILPSLPDINVSLASRPKTKGPPPPLMSTYPLPARYRQFVPSSQKGMHTPEMESRLLKPPIGLSWPGSHSASCRSLMRENPVVAIRLCSPIHTARLFLAPSWPWPTCAGFSWRTSQTRSFLSLEVVTSRLPLAFHESDCTMSLCWSFRGDCPVPMSQSLMLKSPEAEARIFSAAGLKRTWPTFLLGGQTVIRGDCLTVGPSRCSSSPWQIPWICVYAYLVCPVNLLTGATSAGSSASVKRVKSLGTSHMKILPSSEPEATMRSLKGCL